jgi:hypothetical protein
MSLSTRIQLVSVYCVLSMYVCAWLGLLNFSPSASGQLKAVLELIIEQSL